MHKKNIILLITMFFMSSIIVTACKNNQDDIELNKNTQETQTQNSTAFPESDSDETEASGESVSAVAYEQTGIELNLQQAEQVNITLEYYDGIFFSMNVPQGWTMETTGDYENFGFHLYDPAVPGRQIFFYGNMKPFLKSQEAKEAWENYLATGGYADAQLYADAPVLLPATSEQFFTTMDEYATLAHNYGINHQFPVLTDLEFVESAPRYSAIADYTIDDTVSRGFFLNNGVPCDGLFAASVVDAMTSYMGNVDAGYYTVYCITGISAPADEFKYLESILSESLASFQFSDEYIQQGGEQNGWETDAAIQIGQILSDSADSYNQAWYDRQPANDALSQKNSDSSLGYDRLYDIETGETYRAELGFYDEYDSNREEYANPNLQLVPEDSYDLMNKDVTGYIYK